MSQLSVMIKQIRESGIKEIYIRDIDFTTVEDGELKELARLIREMPYLSSVTLQNVNLVSVSSENLELIFKAIASRKESLDVWLPTNNLGASLDKFLLIMEYLLNANANANVKELNLRTNNLHSLDEQILGQLLSFGPNSTLRNIDLSDNKLGQLTNKALLMLGQYLISCKGVTSLQLHHNSLGLNQDACEFLEQLHLLSLEELGLVGNELCDALDPDKSSGERAAKALALHPTLLRLNLADNLLSACGAELLSLFLRCVSQNNRLKKIDLTVNQFEVLRQNDPQWDSFLKNFATFIAGASHSGLEVIYNYCNFDDESKRVLDEMVEKHKALMSPLPFFGGSTNVGVSVQIAIEPIDTAESSEVKAKKVIAALQRIPALSPLFTQREEFRGFLKELDKAWSEAPKDSALFSSLSESIGKGTSLSIK